MNEKDWYKMQDECRRENASETINEKSDILVCMKFDGGCSMIKCMDGHNGTNMSTNYEKL